MTKTNLNALRKKRFLGEKLECVEGGGKRGKNRVEDVYRGKRVLRRSHIT
jgi:hypothetical protein